jgi:hypothetical protein
MATPAEKTERKGEGILAKELELVVARVEDC